MKNEIISQYKASLKMLLDVIYKCSDYLWENDEYENAYWRIVYHTLYYAHLYLGPDSFKPWTKHKLNYHHLGSVNYDNTPIIIEETYSKNDIREYLDYINERCESLVINTTMEMPTGLEWLPMNRGELHLYNIRHIQHHTGQLIERLHQAGIKGIHWESMD